MEPSEFEKPDALLASPKSVWARKRPTTVQVSFATEDGVCATREGPVGFRIGDAMVTGVEGEMWPVDRARFPSIYRPAEGVAEGEPGSYVRRPLLVSAVRLEDPLTVIAGPLGDPIIGAPGDWLVRDQDGAYGVVGGEIFALSYEITGVGSPSETSG